MQVRLMVERGQNECIVKLAGRSYKFVRNERGHLVTEITDLPTIAWVSDTRNSAFMPYPPPKEKPTAEEAKPEPVAGSEIPVSDEVFVEVVPGFSEVPATAAPEPVAPGAEETVNTSEVSESVGETGGAVGAEIPASEETPAAEKVEGEGEVIIPADQVEVSSGDEGAPAPQDKSWKNRKR